MAQHPLHHVTYAHVNFEVATPNGLEGYHFQDNTCDFDLGVKVTLHKMEPSTLYIM